MTNLANIRTKVRKITALLSPNQITDSELNTYINTFYQYDLPNHLRLNALKQTYSFITEPDIDVYSFYKNTNISIEPPVYASGIEISLFQSRESYFDIYPDVMLKETLTTGTGVAGPYLGTITSTPVKRNRVLISTTDSSGNALFAMDTVAGTFSGDVVSGSTIDYQSGVISNLTFNSNISSGTEIFVQSINYASSRPQAILFYNNTFTLSPVPDMAYEIVMNTFVIPSELSNDLDEPQIRQWWQFIAYGTALKIFSDNLDLESYQKTMPFFDDQKRLVERRTLQQLKLNRTKTIYIDDLKYNVPFSSGS